MNQVHGQWYRNDLLLEFYPESECYKLIDSEHAFTFRKIIKIRTKNNNDYNYGWEDPRKMTTSELINDYRRN